MSNFIIISLLLIMFSGCAWERQENSTSRSKPNILFLFADDYTYEAVHTLGNSVIQTPNLDKLVESGTTFTHAYNMGGWNGAICVASRAMIISGRSIWEAKVQSERWRQRDSLALSQNWGQLMREQGYNTYMTGKWHVEHSVNEVFDVVKNVRPGMPKDQRSSEKIPEMKKLLADGGDIQPLMPVGYSRPITPADTSWLPNDTIHGGYWEGGKHWSEIVKDDALDFIADAAPERGSFFHVCGVQCTS